MGAPLSALKQAETRPKEWFSFVRALKRVACTPPIVIDDIVFVKNVDSDTQHTSNKTSYEIKIKD